MELIAVVLVCKERNSKVKRVEGWSNPRMGDHPGKLLRELPETKPCGLEASWELTGFGFVGTPKLSELEARAIPGWVTTLGSCSVSSQEQIREGGVGPAQSGQYLARWSWASPLRHSDLEEASWELTGFGFVGTPKLSKLEARAIPGWVTTLGSCFVSSQKQNRAGWQLQQLERFKIHTWVDKNGGRRREINGVEVSVTSRRFSAFFGQHRPCRQRRRVRKGRGDDGGSNATGPVAGGALWRRRHSLEGDGMNSGEERESRARREKTELVFINPTSKLRGEVRLDYGDIGFVGCICKFRMGGQFRGDTAYFDYVDKDRLSMVEVDYMVQELGYLEGIILYNYKLPGHSNFLTLLWYDEDVVDMCALVLEFKEIEIYLEHLDCDVEDLP
ncbi:hypothetical protein L3X38_045481 [Prunus dulcis]|uniref:PB1-like domain-containing protein n=1 Tax=Prunus dulcis TaxID=3755 RepID=A0AAD4YJM6_PRUDU|nr:hypothetical protein L3X38_045481 [Prunus dulcis]